MKTLLLMRHAKSSWKEDGLADHDRPLNARGKRDAPRMGRLLDAEDRVPDVIVASSARRARDTARRVAEAAGFDGDVVVAPEVYGAGPDTYLAAVRAYGGDAGRVLLVGHNPTLEELVEALTGRHVAMPTAALAEVVLPIRAWDELYDGIYGELAGHWVPRELADG